MFRHTIRPLATVALIAFIGFMTAADVTNAQNTQTRRVMRQKLQHSESLLAALVTSHWNSLETNGRALQTLTMQPGWQALREPEYNKYTTAFERATNRLVDAARARDGQAALSGYSALVGTCVDCHRYVARSRIARTTASPRRPE